MNAKVEALYDEGARRAQREEAKGPLHNESALMRQTEQLLANGFDSVSYRDTAMYERWEEDPYHYAKPDRSPSDDYNWTMIRRAFAGGTDNETSL